MKWVIIVGLIVAEAVFWIAVIYWGRKVLGKNASWKALMDYAWKKIKAWFARWFSR